MSLESSFTGIKSHRAATKICNTPEQKGDKMHVKPNYKATGESEQW